MILNNTIIIYEIEEVNTKLSFIQAPEKPQDRRTGNRVYHSPSNVPRLPYHS